jgi:nucleotide-binding universal stress UspA family protein
MRQFKTILLGLAGSAGDADADALEWAASLAKQNEARLTILAVIPELPRDVRQRIALMRPIMLGDPDKSAVRKRTSQLLGLVDPIRRQGIMGETKVVVGVPVREITREVRQHGHDLLILPAEEKHGLGHWLFGSTALAGLFGRSTVERILRQVDCPVLIVPYYQ